MFKSNARACARNTVLLMRADMQKDHIGLGIFFAGGGAFPVPILPQLCLCEEASEFSMNHPNLGGPWRCCSPQSILEVQ